MPNTTWRTVSTKDVHMPEYRRQILKPVEKDCSIRCSQCLQGDKLFYAIALGTKGGVYFSWDIAENALLGASES
eukprot:1803182-Ditylum_brightwellii.AAC.2